MSITLRQIECFTAVADLLHFGRAAQRTNMTQPALSRQIIALERALNARLLVRGDRAVSLTPAGSTFLEGCHEATRVLQAACRRTRLIERGFLGAIRVGYTDFAISSSLPQCLGAYRRAHENVVLEPFQASTVELLARLEERRLDVAFVTGPVSQPGIVTEPFALNELVVILYESHPLASKPELTIQDLAGEDMVLGIERFWMNYLDHLKRFFAEAGIEPQVVERGYNSEGLFGLIAAQLGLTIYPDCARNYIRRGLVVRELTGPPVFIPTDIAWREGEQSGVLAEFLTHFRDTDTGPGGTARPSPPGGDT